MIEKELGIRISLAFTALTAMVTNMIASKSINFFRSSAVKTLRFVFCGVVVCGLVVPKTHAQSLAALRVVDCNGHTRAMKNVDIGEVTDVEVRLKSLDVKDLRLINGKGEVLHGEIDEDVATFSDVPTDIWVLTSNDPAAFYTEISFNPSLPGFWIRAGEVVLVAAGVVGIVALAGAFDGGGGNNGGGSGGSDDCPTCNPDQEAPSVGPFSMTR